MTSLKLVLIGVVCIQLAFPVPVFAEPKEGLPLTDALMPAIAKELEQNLARIPHAEEAKPGIKKALAQLQARIQAKEKEFQTKIPDSPEVLAARVAKLGKDAKALEQQLKSLGAGEPGESELSPYRSKNGAMILDAKAKLEHINNELQDTLIEALIVKTKQEQHFIDSDRGTFDGVRLLDLIIKGFAAMMLAGFSYVMLGITYGPDSIPPYPTSLAVGVAGMTAAVISSIISYDKLKAANTSKEQFKGALYSGPFALATIAIDETHKNFAQYLDKLRFARALKKGLKNNEDVLVALMAYMGESGCAFATKEALTGEPVKFRIALPGDSKVKKRIATEPSVKTRIATDPPVEQPLHYEDEITAPLKTKTLPGPQ